jgi:cleavage and polyadenylation specificity factor subunit 2
MARIAATEDVEGIREEQDVGDENLKREQETAIDLDQLPRAAERNVKEKYVATVQEVHDSFDSVNTLRYSQPTHLQGTFHCLFITHLA